MNYKQLDIKVKIALVSAIASPVVTGICGIGLAFQNNHLQKELINIENEFIEKDRKNNARIEFDRVAIRNIEYIENLEEAFFEPFINSNINDLVETLEKNLVTFLGSPETQKTNKNMLLIDPALIHVKSLKPNYSHFNREDNSLEDIAFIERKRKVKSEIRILFQGTNIYELIDDLSNKFDGNLTSRFFENMDTQLDLLSNYEDSILDATAPSRISEIIEKLVSDLEDLDQILVDQTDQFYRITEDARILHNEISDALYKEMID